MKAMKDIPLSPRELAAKAAAARKNVTTRLSLRTQPRPDAGASYMVEKMLYVWFPEDRTTHDAYHSIALLLAEKEAGRFRRVTFAVQPPRRKA